MILRSDESSGSALEITAPVDSTLCIPIELLTFLPPIDAVHKYFFKGTSKQVAIRALYLHQPLTEVEKTWLREFSATCRAENLHVPVELHSVLLRVLLFNWRKHKENYLLKACEHIQEMIEWRRLSFPFSDTESELVKLLNLGLIYWCGRDALLRPLLVIRLSRLPKTCSPAMFIRLVVFGMEWGLRYLMVPGKVETCNVLLDIRGVSLYSVPVSALSDLTTTLTKQYPFRLDKMWIINDSLIMQTFWSVIKSFLTEVQQQKMNFCRHGYQKLLLKEHACHQLEKTFGGTREDFTRFYPFPMAPGPFAAGYKGGPNLNAPQDGYKAIDEITMRGLVWGADDMGTPTLWTEEAYRICREANVVPPTIPCRRMLSDVKEYRGTATEELSTVETRVHHRRGNSLLHRLSGSSTHRVKNTKSAASSVLSEYNNEDASQDSRLLTDAPTKHRNRRYSWLSKQSHHSSASLDEHRPADKARRKNSIAENEDTTNDNTLQSCPIAVKTTALVPVRPFYPTSGCDVVAPSCSSSNKCATHLSSSGMSDSDFDEQRDDNSSSVYSVEDHLNRSQRLPPVATVVGVERALNDEFDVGSANRIRLCLKMRRKSSSMSISSVNLTYNVTSETHCEEYDTSHQTKSINENRGLKPVVSVSADGYCVVDELNGVPVEIQESKNFDGKSGRRWSRIFRRRPRVFIPINPRQYRKKPLRHQPDLCAVSPDVSCCLSPPTKTCCGFI
eukprot:Lankesteria_metandrocarpae@DN2029_c0_g1_i1.p2